MDTGFRRYDEYFSATTLAPGFFKRAPAAREDGDAD
jgi:hypothetical protein